MVEPFRTNSSDGNVTVVLGCSVRVCSLQGSWLVEYVLLNVRLVAPFNCYAFCYRQVGLQLCRQPYLR
jgi:hypothetical protein